jgi:Kef-type K+ transport system membrane component KefB/nucleotide-binding universal stress UspA family protein
VTRRLLVALLCVVAVPALAAAQKNSGGVGGRGEVILIAEIAVLMLVGRGLGEMMQRFGQPAVIGQLLAGLILGPSLFGWLWPEAHALIFPNSAEQKELITGIANIGVMMLLLLTGMDTDLNLVRKVGRPAIAVAAAGVTIPFASGVALGEFLPASILPDPHARLITALFLGTALSISSIKVVAMVVHEMHFTRRNLGQIIVSSAIIEDTIGWVIVSITLGIAGAGGISASGLAKTLIGTTLFLVASYTAGRWLVFQLIRWVNDTFVSEYAVITAILLVMCGMALLTQAIGVNTVLGAFVAGVLVGESPILSGQIRDTLRGLITAFMMPIFFGLSGLAADLTILRDPGLLLMTLALVIVASLGKFAGAFAGGRIGGLTARESLAIGCAMNARGSTEVIVATIGLSLGALTLNLYSMVVAMAVITTMAMPPLLRWALSRLPIKQEERERLTNEALDAKGFVSRFERLLIAADESPNGKFASRLAGFIAGKRGMPVTVLQLKTQSRSAKSEGIELEQAAAEAAAAGRQTASEGKEQPKKAEISARVEPKSADAVAKEAEKGYDILFIGQRRMLRPDGSFSENVDRMARKFEGPLALVFAGELQDAADLSEFNTLVPVNGTEASRRGAELAFALASPEGSRIAALLVSERKARSLAKQARDRTEKAILADITALAARHGFDDLRTAVHMSEAPDAAILEEAKRTAAELIVIGTSRRAGDVLFLGETTSSLLKTWKGAFVVFVT